MTVSLEMDHDWNSPDQKRLSRLPPSVAFGRLFHDMMMYVGADGNGLAHDPKTIIDFYWKYPIAYITSRYEQAKQQPDFHLPDFVRAHFDLPCEPDVSNITKLGDTCSDFARAAWPLLTREPDSTSQLSSLYPLKKAYVVPGGRFRECYFWDSYFTMHGLLLSGKSDLVQSMLDNFVDQIEHFGFIPNGNRSYYVGRSQPPYFQKMVQLLAENQSTKEAEKAIYATYLPAMLQEDTFWMDGMQSIRIGQAHRRVVCMNDGDQGVFLNRYWDDYETPRDESYPYDIKTATASGRPHEEVYRELRAAAESGFDFSSRWFSDGNTLESISITRLAPVCLNSLRAESERIIAQALLLCDDELTAQQYLHRAEKRERAIQTLMWNADRQMFTDIEWSTGTQTNILSAAAAYPLYCDIATPDQAQQQRDTIWEKMLYPSGIPVTLQTTGQQWDFPMVWAPLQHIVAVGFCKFGYIEEAYEIAKRFTGAVESYFAQHGVMVEKYDATAAIDDSREGSGGEYENQVGFGWTIAEYQRMKHFMHKYETGMPDERQIHHG